MSKRKCCLFKYFDDGEITPPPASSILPTSTGHPRTRSRWGRARRNQCGTVRGGGGTTRHRSLQWAFARATNDCQHCIFRKEFNNVRTSSERSTIQWQLSKFRVCHLSTGTPPSPNFNCPVSARWLSNPPPTPVPSLQLKSSNGLGRKPCRAADKTLTPSPGSRRRALAFKGGEAALSLPGSPLPGQPFSANESPVAKSSRVVQYPGGLRNTEPLIARNRKGGRGAWRARHSIAWSLRAQPQFVETYPIAHTVGALAQQQHPPPPTSLPSTLHMCDRIGEK